jgi:hypothetical protein
LRIDLSRLVSFEALDGDLVGPHVALRGTHDTASLGDFFYFWIEAVPQTTDDPRKKDLNHLLTLVLGTWGFALDTCIVTTQPGSYGLFPQQGME